MVNFEVASSSSFRDYPRRLFYDSEVGDDSSGMSVICRRLEVADNMVSSENVDTFCC